MQRSIFFLLILLMSAVCTGSPDSTTIVDYLPEHESAIMQISFEDPQLFFPGLAGIPSDMSDYIEKSCTELMTSACNNSKMRKKVLLDDSNVVAFVMFFKACEQSLQALKSDPLMAGWSDQQVLDIWPNIKLTDEECKNYVELNGLAVARDHRGRGYGRKLLQAAVEESKQLWPAIDQMRLNVNASNQRARTLYESEGFVVSEEQPPHLVQMQSVQYEKSI